MVFRLCEWTWALLKRYQCPQHLPWVRWALPQRARDRRPVLGEHDDKPSGGRRDEEGVVAVCQVLAEAWWAPV